MRISLNWLRELVEISDPESLPRRLTFAGFEVEAVDQLGLGLEQVVVARILSSVPHPKADRLSVTQVDAGDRQLQIVCGAKNYQVGDLVPLAPVGAVLPNDLRIAEAELRGVTSSGMLCSQRELGLSETQEGLFILPSGKPGQRLLEALPIADVVFEINVTPNRADCLSHLGIAREMAALTGVALRNAMSATVPPTVAVPAGLAAPRLEAPERCGRFLGQVLEGGATLASPSPFGLQARLSACGVRPLGLAVDVTNAVMLELGQPLHAYDLDKLTHGIVVRLARTGERLTTLDGVERLLDPDDLLICDGDLPIGLAGVMGGASTAVSASTRRLYLEAAYFTPGGIRRSAKRHGLPSEASHRFERGVDPALAPIALARAVALLAAQLKGAQASVVQVAEGQLPQARTVRLSFGQVASLLGLPLSPADVTDRLASVGILAGVVEPASAAFAIPSHRQDLTEPVDLVAEVARIGGIEAIAPRPPVHVLPPPEISAEQRSLTLLRGELSGAGFAETVQFSFLAGPLADAFASPVSAPAVRLLNALKQEQGALRRSLLPGLCETARRNLAHLTRDAGAAPSLRLYEQARVYAWPRPDEPSEGPVSERLKLGLLWTGPRFPLSWNSPREAADFSDLRGVLERLFGRVGRPLRLSVSEQPFLHPRSAAVLWSGDARVGVAGEIHPSVAQKFDLPRQLLLAELDLERLLASPPLPPGTGVPKFPAVLRDIALVVAEATPEANVAEALRVAGGELLEQIVLFDVYVGTPLARGEKSLAYSLRFRASDRTLTDAEVASCQRAMLAEVASRHGARLRA